MNEVRRLINSQAAASAPTSRLKTQNFAIEVSASRERCTTQPKLKATPYPTSGASCGSAVWSGVGMPAQ